MTRLATSARRLIRYLPMIFCAPMLTLHVNNLPEKGGRQYASPCGHLPGSIWDTRSLAQRKVLAVASTSGGGPGAVTGPVVARAALAPTPSGHLGLLRYVP